MFIFYLVLFPGNSWHYGDDYQEAGYEIRGSFWSVLSAAAVAYLFWGDTFMRLLVMDTSL